MFPTTAERSGPASKDTACRSPPVGKIDVAVAPTNSNRVFALIQTKDQGSVWRSDDGGEQWKAVNYQRALIGRAGYYIRIAVSTGSDNEVYVANSSFHQSLDGGENFREVRWGGDTHDIWIDPTNPDRFVITDDGGMIITTVHGRGFHRVTLPIGQMYHVAVDNQDSVLLLQQHAGRREHAGPECACGLRRDRLGPPNGRLRIRLHRSRYGRSQRRVGYLLWQHSYPLGRPKQGSALREPLDAYPGLAAQRLKYRCHWTPPLAVDPFDHKTVYYGCQVIFKTTNAGHSWSVISPDLSTQDPAHLVPSGGIVGDNLGQFYGEVVYAIAPSKIQKGLIWAGTNDGQVWYTKDGGGKLDQRHQEHQRASSVGARLPALRPRLLIPAPHISASIFHLVDNRDPFIYKTTDLGKTWKPISSNLPKHQLSYVRSVTEDPNCAGLLFAGTGNGLYYSLDDGGHWTALQGGLPHSPVSWAVVQKDFHDLVISTYGRGLYILDDITPLEQLAKKHSDAAVICLSRVQPTASARAPQAMLNFNLKAAPKNPVELEILDAQGSVVRKLEAKGQPGHQSGEVGHAL